MSTCLFPGYTINVYYFKKNSPHTHSVLLVSMPILMAQALAWHHCLMCFFLITKPGWYDGRVKSSKKTRADGKHKLVYYQLWSLPHTQLMFFVSTFLQSENITENFGRFTVYRTCVRFCIAGFLRRSLVLSMSINMRKSSFSSQQTNFKPNISFLNDDTTSH